MNIFNFIARGTAGASTDETRRQDRLNDESEKARALWIHSLQADETRAWLNLGEAQHRTLSGLAILLTIAGFCHVHDGGTVDTPELRTIRGAISTIESCGKAGGVIDEVDIVTFQVACTRAKEIIRKASVAAIQHAAVSIREATGATA
jgi:hypothetical protein